MIYLVYHVLLLKKYGEKMKKWIILLTLSESVLVLMGCLLREKILIIFAISLLVYLMIFRALYDFSNNYNKKNLERNLLVKLNFISSLSLLSMIMAICAVMDYFFRISKKNEILLTFMVLVPSAIVVANLFIRISKLPPKERR